jgi:hypothetical protein
MSRFKEGEGLWYITPDIFTSQVLELGKRYTVLLLADGDVVIKGYVVAGVGNFDADWNLTLGADDMTYLSLKLPYFSSHYINGFDIIIRDDEKTLIMLPNVSYSRG